MKSPIIKCDNYTLQPFTDEDVKLWQIWDVDPEIQSHMPEPKNDPVSLEEQLAYIKECEGDGEGYYWSIHSNNQNEIIGTVALTDIDSYHKRAEIGIMIGDKNYWGKDVATQVCTCLTSHAFENLDIRAITAEVEIDNIAMRKALEKSGFIQDGHFKNARVKNGGYTDVLHFSKIK